MGVTAVDADLAVYWRAGRGLHVRFAAPGVAPRVADQDGGTRLRSGTSMAASFVTAILARRLAEARQDSPQQLLRLLDMYAGDLGPAGHDLIYGAGLTRAVPPAELSKRAR